MATAFAPNVAACSVNRVTNNGVPVAGSRPHPRSVQPSERVVQRRAASGGTPGMPVVLGGSSRGVSGTAKSGPFIRRIASPVATGSRLSASTVIWSAGWSGRMRGTSSTTSRHRRRARRSHGASRASTSRSRSARQSLSAVAGSTP